MSRFVVLPRQVSVLVYGDDDPTNYSASAQIFIYGDRGMMYNIIGKSFYTVAIQQIAKLFEALKIRVLEGYMCDGHARLLSQALKDLVTVSYCGRGEIAGHDMPWVVVTLKEKHDEVAQKPCGEEFKAGGCGNHA